MQPKLVQEELKNLAKFPLKNPYPVFRISSSNKILFCNNSALRLLKEIGAKKDEFNKILPANISLLVKKSIKSKKIVKNVEVIAGKKIFSCTIVPITECGYVNVYFTEVTNRKQMEEELQHQKELAQHYLDIVDTIIIALDRRGNITFINKKGCQSLGRKVKDILGKNWFDNFIPKKIKQDLKKYFAMLINGQMQVGEYHENIIITAGDNERLIAWHNAYLRDKAGKICGTLGSGEDVTELRKMQEVLRESWRKYHDLVENIQEGIWVLDKDGFTNYVNAPMAKMLGYSIAEMLSKHADTFLQDDSRAEFSQYIEERKKGFRVYREFKLLGKDKRPLFAMVQAGPIYDEHGGYRGIICGVMDVTERKYAQDALQQVLRQWQITFNSARDSIMLIDKDHKIIRANSETEKILNLPLEEILGRKCYELIHEAHDIIEGCPLEQAIKNKNRAEMELYLPKEDKYMLISVDPIINEDGKVLSVVHIMRDVTERKRAEQLIKNDRDRLEGVVGKQEVELVEKQKELEDAKRLSDIGALAATVAHELRNPLGVIKTAAYNIRKKANNINLDSHITNIDKKIAESEQIIKNLLGYSRIKIPAYEFVMVNSILRDCIEETKRKYLGWQVKIDFNSALEEAFVIEADPFQLNEVFLNILDNAFLSFMSKSGNIFISSKIDAKSNIFEIDFKDDGVGIAKENMNRLFEPFFTTRSKGTGLGLKVCRELIKLHGGTISIESRQGFGTNIKIRFPVKKVE